MYKTPQALSLNTSCWGLLYFDHVCTKVCAKHSISFNKRYKKWMKDNKCPCRDHKDKHPRLQDACQGFKLFSRPRTSLNTSFRLIQFKQRFSILSSKCLFRVLYTQTFEYSQQWPIQVDTQVSFLCFFCRCHRLFLQRRAKFHRLNCLPLQH